MAKLSVRKVRTCHGESWATITPRGAIEFGDGISAWKLALELAIEKDARGYIVTDPRQFVYVAPRAVTEGRNA